MSSPTPPIPRAVLFDWDNTLVDTWGVIHDALNTTFAAMGTPLWTLDETRQRVGRSLRETFPEMFGERWEEARDVFYGRYREIHLVKLEARPGALALIRALADAEVYLAVVSNKSGGHLRAEASHLGWESYFSRLVGATDAAKDKPALDPVIMALENGRVTPGRDVWFVGDTPIDMECAHNSGCIPVLIRESPPEAGEFDSYPPEYHFRDCAKLATLASAL